MSILTNLIVRDLRASEQRSDQGIEIRVSEPRSPFPPSCYLTNEIHNRAEKHDN